MSRVTLRDVAGVAGSSVAAVSLVLNGKAEKARIKPATQERIRAAARRLGYQPNQMARDIVLRRPYAGIRKPVAAGAPGEGLQGLQGRRGRQVGVVLSPKTSKDTLGLLPGVIQELAAAGYRLVVLEIELEAPAGARQQAMQLLEECAGGVLCCPTTYPMVSAVAAETPAGSPEGSRKVIVLWQGAGRALTMKAPEPMAAPAVRPVPVVRAPEPRPVVRPVAAAAAGLEQERTTRTAGTERTTTPEAVPGTGTTDAQEPTQLPVQPAEGVQLVFDFSLARAGRNIC